MISSGLLLGLLLLWPAPPAQPQPIETKTYQVPYRLTDTQHVMVRAKLNGKGPYNFIVDTGAPMLYIAVPVAEKVGLKAAEKKAATLDRLELEGGAVLTQIKCMVETPYQLEGMNAMGAPGVELHGILGYSVLAHFRMEFDFTRDKMTWTRLNFTPPAPIPLGLKETPGGLDQLGKLMKALVALSGLKPPPPPVARGFLGVELTDMDGRVVVKAVLENSPAAKAGLMVGDRIRAVQGKEVQTGADVLALVAQVRAGAEVRFDILRGEEKREIRVTAGEGL